MTSKLVISMVEGYFYEKNGVEGYIHKDAKTMCPICESGLSPVLSIHLKKLKFTNVFK